MLQIGSIALFVRLAAFAAMTASSAAAQQTASATAPMGIDVSGMRQISTYMGEMGMTGQALDHTVEDTLRFEPYQQLTDMFTRDDVVFLMRHGPTDWSKLDMANVAPADCVNQRVMSDEGRARMRDMGALLAANGIVPARISRANGAETSRPSSTCFKAWTRSIRPSPAPCRWRRRQT